MSGPGRLLLDIQSSGAPKMEGLALRLYSPLETSDSSPAFLNCQRTDLFMEDFVTAKSASAQLGLIHHTANFIAFGRRFAKQWRHTYNQQKCTDGISQREIPHQ